LDLGGGKRLQYPKLFIHPDDRIGITGRNGSGKSTLIGTLIPALNVPDEQVTYVPQEISASRSRTIIEDVRALPPEQKGHLMTIVSCLGSRPRQLLESDYPSPGEVRKLLLALGMTQEPHVIVMDEPTNHMDLPSIECLEEALAPCPCCLVLISHDREFLGRLTQRRWRIHTEGANRYRLDVE
jgi:ATPase subunit of ABC transporter with duplicated ATPase domains